MRKYFFPLLLIASTAVVSACTQDGFDCREATACALLRDKVDGVNYALEDTVQATAIYGSDTGQQFENWSNELDVPSRKDVTSKAQSTWLAVKREVPAAKQEVSRWRFDPAAVPQSWEKFKFLYLP